MINLLIVENQLNKKNNQEKRKSLLLTIKESAANIWNALTKKTQTAATVAQTTATGAQATATGTATIAQK